VIWECCREYPKIFKKWFKNDVFDKKDTNKQDFKNKPRNDLLFLPEILNQIKIYNNEI